ncbi:TPR repeat region-containing protein [Nocardia salmonicida]|uniref:TPR repeat region-containing protein n=1 Tax=Nocardia salmonicida TaxID=53431 RepID=UPI002E2D655C|nr:hypothetical protein [Nocardia salmonicida]
MHKRSAVEKWDLEAVKTWGTQVASARGALMVCADTTMTHMRDMQASWAGAAYLAAYDRVAGDHLQVQKLAMEVDELVTVINDQVDNVVSHRTTLLGKVTDAQGLGMTIDDVWKVMDYDNVEADVRRDHQQLINNALYPFEDAVTKAVQAITGQATEIRSAGDLLGSSLDVSAADTQAGRFGKDDGTELAEAVKNHDKAKIDEILAQMPQPALSQFEIDQLAAGNEVNTLPQSTQDYYKTFLQSAGKDGILGLNEQLLARESAGDTTAAAQRNNLANTVLAMTNEKVGTSNGSKGSYSNLPPDLQNLVSGRAEDFTGAYNGENQLVNRYQELGQFSQLLNQSDPGMQPGKQLGVELGKQSESITAYLDNIDSNNAKHMPPGFSEEDRVTMEEGAQSFLEVATRNDDVSYSLLTGNGMPDSPDIGSEYKNDRPYDAEEFRNTIFRNEWADDGKAASGLLDWIAEDTKKPGEEGLRANEAFAALPEYFAPSGDAPDGSASERPELKDEDGKTVFNRSVDAFNANPQLADSMAHIMGNNIDSYISGHALESGLVDDPGLPGNDKRLAELSVTDADRMLFLAGQSEGGRLMLEVSRQEYESTKIGEALAEGGDNPATWLETNAPNLAELDGRYTNAINNALTWQDEQNAQASFDEKTKTFENRQQAADIVKSLTLDNLEIPGKSPAGVIGNEVFGVLKDEGYNAAMEKWNPEPEKEGVVPPNSDALTTRSENEVRSIILQEMMKEGTLPAFGIDTNGNRIDYLDSNGRIIDVGEISGPAMTAVNRTLTDRGLQDYVTDYGQAHTIALNTNLKSDPSEVKAYVTGKTGGGK